MTRATMPHCDSNVLHAPDECIYCDEYPDWQAKRVADGINFTGWGEDPATERRPLDVINRWHGNIPMTAEQQAIDDKEWASLYDWPHDWPEN